jgi:hemerythrin-like metal-binding protein
VFFVVIVKPILWTKDLSVGIKKIDDQHKKFILILNSVGSLKTKPPEEKLTFILNDLIDYARYHFETEEIYFDKYNYPFADEHKLQHAELLQNALSLYDKHKNRKDITKELFVFLKDWLEEHLAKHDQKYAKFFKEIGVSK